MKYRFLSLLLLFSAYAAGQSTVPYTHDYEFKEGVFLTYTQFIKNSPVLKSNIVSSVPAGNIDFLSEVLEQKMLTYKDSAGTEQKVEVSSVWGYCQNRALYVNYNKGFDRLNVIGNLSLFSSVIVHAPMERDPMGNIYNVNTSYDELRQFVLDTQSNKIWDFNVKSMEVLLKSDDVLYQSFMKLKKREKADSIFIYLRKYNEKHPLYLPAK
ncbi:MAG: hypothetical protein ACJ77K_08760 [Bacteroidia bacterium]|jgi:hypothetical protein